jgi:hypothetical protein
VTVLVGVRCTDGAVIGSDSIATSSVGQMPLIQVQFDGKIRIFSERVIVATTGAIGFSQRLHQHVEAAINGKVFLNFDTRRCTNNIASRFIGDLQESKAPNHPTEGIRFGALVAAACADGPFLAEFATTDFQPEIKAGEMFCVTMGSGQLLADPFMAFVSKVLWQGKMPTVNEGKFGVYWVLSHTLRLAPGQVGPPIRLATLGQVEGQWVAREEDTQESAEYVEELEDHIGKFVRAPIQTAPPAEPIPEPPAANLGGAAGR